MFRQPPTVITLRPPLYFQPLVNARKQHDSDAKQVLVRNAFNSGVRYAIFLKALLCCEVAFHEGGHENEEA